MLPYPHIIIGAIFSYVLFLLFPQIEIAGFLIIFFSSFLIDIDHYIYYAFRKKDISPIRAVKWFFQNRSLLLRLSKEKRKEFYNGVYFLHGIEFLIILFFLTFISKYFLYVLIGFLFHIFLDLIYSIKNKNNFLRASTINAFLKSRRLKHIGN